MRCGEGQGRGVLVKSEEVRSGSEIRHEGFGDFFSFCELHI